MLHPHQAFHAWVTGSTSSEASANAILRGRRNDSLKTQTLSLPIWNSSNTGRLWNYAPPPVFLQHIFSYSTIEQSGIGPTMHLTNRNMEHVSFILTGNWASYKQSPVYCCFLPILRGHQVLDSKHNQQLRASLDINCFPPACWQRNSSLKNYWQTIRTRLATSQLKVFPQLPIRQCCSNIPLNYTW